MITVQNYVRPQSLEEAYELNQKRQNRIIGGMMWLNLGHGSIHTAIDLCDLRLDTIEETPETFSVGAMVTLRQLEQNEALNRFTQGAIRDAVKNIVGVQFRNMATVGGSLWGRFGFSDVLTLFMAMDCFVELYRGGTVPLETFASMKPDRDILLRIIIKKKPIRICYDSVRIQRTDFPAAACAVSLSDGQYRAVIGARPHRALVVRDEEQLLSLGITEQSAQAFAEYTAAHAPTASNAHAGAAYRMHLIEVLTRRNLERIGGLTEWKSE